MWNLFSEYKVKLTVVSKGLCGEDLSKCYSIRVLNLLPHVHQHHALCVYEAEPLEIKKTSNKNEHFNAIYQTSELHPV